MWLATQFGWFSVVRKADGHHLRARVRADLQALLEAIDMDDDCEILEWDGADYRYRCILDVEQLLEIFVQFAASIDYPNFKSRIAADRSQFEKLGAYNEIWSIMAQFQDDASEPART